MTLTGERLIEGFLKPSRLRGRSTTPDGLADGFVHVDDRPRFHSCILMAFVALAKPFRNRFRRFIRSPEDSHGGHGAHGRRIRHACSVPFVSCVRDLSPTASAKNHGGKRVESGAVALAFEGGVDALEGTAQRAWGADRNELHAQSERGIDPSVYRTHSTRTAAQTISRMRLREEAPAPSWKALPGKGSQLSRSRLGLGWGRRVRAGSYWPVLPPSL